MDGRMEWISYPNLKSSFAPKSKALGSLSPKGKPIYRVSFIPKI
jgi:hypothetical protein